MRFPEESPLSTARLMEGSPLSSRARLVDRYIVRPVLSRYFSEYSMDSARNLLLGTCAQESDMGLYCQQIRGPALGIFQMEMATYYDNIAWAWRNSSALKFIKEFDEFDPFGGFHGNPPAQVLMYDGRFAAAMARIHYLRRPEPLPASDDWEGLAMYWKAHYNTVKGAGTVGAFLQSCRHHGLIR